jgi:nucleoside-diphosphate kinase
MPVSADIEHTLAILKPDAVQRGLIGEILGRVERKGLKIVAMKLVQIDRALAERHYAEHKGKPFYEPLLAFITSGPAVVLILEGHQAIRAWRSIMGSTNPLDASPGSIRGDYATETTLNLVHGSDAPETATKEIALFFGPEERVTHSS